MASSIETSTKTNKNFYTIVFVLLFSSKLLLVRKFKQFCLNDVLAFYNEIAKFSYSSKMAILK